MGQAKKLLERAEDALYPHYYPLYRKYQLFDPEVVSLVPWKNTSKANYFIIG